MAANSIGVITAWMWCKLSSLSVGLRCVRNAGLDSSGLEKGHSSALGLGESGMLGLTVVGL
jgi:hypothetical protein